MATLQWRHVLRWLAGPTAGKRDSILPMLSRRAQATRCVSSKPEVRQLMRARLRVNPGSGARRGRRA